MKYFAHCLLTRIFSNENSGWYHCLFLLYVKVFFFLSDSFFIFFYYYWFWAIDYDALGVIFYISLVTGAHWASQICRFIFFITFGKFSTIISSNVFFCNPFSLLCFRDSNYIHGRPLEVVPQITDNTVHFSKFFLCFILNRFYCGFFIFVSCVHDFSSAGLTCYYLSTYFLYIH